jgi:hypothetical protein
VKRRIEMSTNLSNLILLFGFIDIYIHTETHSLGFFLSSRMYKKRKEKKKEKIDVYKNTQKKKNF